MSEKAHFDTFKKKLNIYNHFYRLPWSEKNLETLNLLEYLNNFDIKKRLRILRTIHVKIYISGSHPAVECMHFS